jgi:hypothetical protein
MKAADRFIPLWNRYFPGADLPIAFFYTAQASEMDLQDTQNLERRRIGINGATTKFRLPEDNKA